ncbi:VOC family protein [Nocardioides mesophilus]|uniref:VOC family protein n=1 Tax=Nocardioides mesophilus TaxID=433659 RepID=A0A7G9R793_9ACTN|nr:VOC family protein [Nocardioides mesophilus]QNN51468.1 VOC family protein [Nocardioides mesophilus]
MSEQQPERPGGRRRPSRQIYVHLPVADLASSIAFFTALGFDVAPDSTDADATALVVGEAAFVMLLTRPFFAGFTRKPVADPTVTEVTVAVSARTRREVDELVDRALELGAQPCREAQDRGFMYGRSFYDLDGHLWELIWSDPDAFAA